MDSRLPGGSELIPDQAQQRNGEAQIERGGAETSCHWRRARLTSSPWAGSAVVLVRAHTRRGPAATSAPCPWPARIGWPHSAMDSRLPGGSETAA